MKFAGRDCCLVCLFDTVSVQEVNFRIANHEKEEWINGETTEDVVAFLDRLYTAKRTVEQRIVVLGGEQDPVGIIHSAFLPALLTLFI